MATYGIIVFFRFEKLTEEDEKIARSEWEKVKKEFPETVKLLGVYYHAMGTRYNGFLLIETTDLNDFFSFWKTFKDKIRWYVSETTTIISMKAE